ncbi:MAG: hypothetical protein PHN63_01500 [Candidatus Omnitrophica bacterium]|nr:hypothetical protein [Candidatus Omnitrophota bacterium]
MWTFIILVSVIWVGFFVWARIDSKKRQKENIKKTAKPAFRTEEDLDEYGKPMKDEHQSPVDFDDAE